MMSRKMSGKLSTQWFRSVLCLFLCLTCIQHIFPSTYHVPKSVLDILEYEHDFDEVPELKKPQNRMYLENCNMIGCLESFQICLLPTGSPEGLRRIGRLVDDLGNYLVLHFFNTSLAVSPGKSLFLLVPLFSVHC